MRPCFRLLATALALPCLILAAAANEVGLESAGPTGSAKTPASVWPPSTATRA